MTHLKKSLALLMLLTVITGSRVSAQDLFRLIPVLNERGMEVMQNNEIISTGEETGNFYLNPLQLDGKPLDYNFFSLKSEGNLTVVKGAAETGKTTLIPFYISLRRNGHTVTIPGQDRSHVNQIIIDISEVLKYGKAGDLLVIEPVRKADGAAKRILKLLEGGC